MITFLSIHPLAMRGSQSRQDAFCFEIHIYICSSIILTKLSLSSN